MDMEKGTNMYQLKYLLIQLNCLPIKQYAYLKINLKSRRNIPDWFESVSAASHSNFEMQARPSNPWLNKQINKFAQYIYTQHSVYN